MKPKTIITIVILIVLLTSSININALKIQKTNTQKISSKSDAEEYDMVIITPAIFKFALKPLVTHKNNNGIKTFIKTTQEIYRNYPGRDKPEQIKYFIKDAKEKQGVDYVFLVGGRIWQFSKWYVPVRYSNLFDKSSFNETSYISDLYYADLYRYNETSCEYEFEDWDSNKNKVFGEWTWFYNDTTGEYDVVDKKDEIDLIPDVYVGRIPCRNIFEVKTMVKKIISYENSVFNQSWFKNLVLAGGDTTPPSDGLADFFEGEIETEQAAKILEPEGFNVDRLWTSNGNLTGRDDVIDAFNKGAGFVYLSGHGNPAAWSTHPPNNENEYVNGLFVWDVKELKNKDKLPIVIVSSCHNSMFDVTIFNLIKDPLGSLIDATSVRECWSWRLIRQKNGGAIATIGNTGLGWGETDINCTDHLDGWINSRFFENYVNISNNHILGKIHGQTIKDYVNNFPVNDEVLDRKTVEQWVLLGDPSLRIGGIEK